MDILLQKANALANQPALPVTPIPNRIAYVVSHGQSYASNGYAIRTQGIAKALNDHGFETLCFVRPGRPWELGVEKGSVQPEVVLDGVRYIHSRWDNMKKPGNETEHLERSVERFMELFRVYRPAAVLAASNYIVGLPAWVAAKRLGLPFYNEVRGFWELSRDAREPGYSQTAEFKAEAERDTFVAKQALKVFTLNQPMKEELGRRGVELNRIDIVPNGVSKRPEIKRADPTLKQKLGIQPDDKVVGYVGSFNPYEGLDTLLDACAELAKRGEKFKLLLVGDDQPVTAAHSPATKQQGKHPWLIQVGRVPHEQVAEYYALIDVVVIPRKKLPVCELVPPMKVVEALAHQKQIVVSDVQPLTEYVINRSGVSSFKNGDSESLITALQASLNRTIKSQSSIQELLSNSAVPITVALNARLNPSQIRVASTEPAVAEKPTKKSAIGFLNQAETLELPVKDPLWFSIPVQPGQDLIINAAVEYRNVQGVTNRKAVLLIKSYDSSGQEVDKPCGKMAKSGHLKAYFKYLPCTVNKVQEQHSFKVPEGVAEIRLGLCGFNKAVQEKVFVRELQVRPKADKLKLVQFIPPSKQAAEISILGWPEYPNNGKPYVIGVMDEFTTGCFEQDLNLIQPRPDNWYALAEKYKPELFFIESAWKGNFGSWQYRVAEYANKPGHEIAHICQYAREKGIPTLFWNKEDPVHHDKFMCSARLVDYIFTTDANMIDSYRAKTGNNKVYALPFAAQPALHKPAPLVGRKPLSCFAGSWYGNRHAERGEAMGWLLQAANKYGLEIYDRNYGTGVFPFPEEYQKGIKGSLPYKELCEEYRRYRVFLNVNSVTNSPTMFSRRVFELMACGTPVVSTYAKGIEDLFESNAVWMVRSQQEADEALHTLMTDDVEWRRRSLAGIREVFAKHTYAHRLNDIFEKLGIETRMLTDPAILLVSEAETKGELEALNRFAQTQNYPRFRIGVECKESLEAAASHLHETITLLQPGEKSAWIAKQQNDYPIAGWINPHSHYGEHYLRDLANASLYEPNASGWAKSQGQDVFSYGKSAALDGSLWKSTVFTKQFMDMKPQMTVQRPDLYSADSDQFRAAPVKQLDVVEG